MRAAVLQQGKNISIHALREEGDSEADLQFSKSGYFYPRPPRGGRHDIIGRTYLFEAFLSTPSARRATGVGGAGRGNFGISIHALREEGDFCLNVSKDGMGDISIHALREEGDRLLQLHPLP